jgi:hypothetical protein
VTDVVIISEGDAPGAQLRCGSAKISGLLATVNGESRARLAAIYDNLTGGLTS